MSDLDQQRNRKLLKKVVSSKLNSFNLDENAGPFIPFESDTQQKILEGLSTIQSWVLMARLDRTSGGSNTKEVTLTCLATPYSLLTSSTQRSQRRICLQYAFSLFFLIKKIIGLNDQIYISPPLGGSSVIIWMNWSSRCYSKRKCSVQIAANDACVINDSIFLSTLWFIFLFENSNMTFC